MSLGSACRELQPIAGVICAEAALCSQIAAGVNSGWDNELSMLTARTMAGGIAQWATLLRPLQMECLEQETAAALAEA